VLPCLWWNKDHQYTVSRTSHSKIKQNITKKLPRCVWYAYSIFENQCSVALKSYLIKLPTATASHVWQQHQNYVISGMTLRVNSSCATLSGSFLPDALSTFYRCQRMLKQNTSVFFRKWNMYETYDVTLSHSPVSSTSRLRIIHAIRSVPTHHHHHYTLYNVYIRWCRNSNTDRPSAEIQSAKTNAFIAITWSYHTPLRQKFHHSHVVKNAY